MFATRKYRDQVAAIAPGFVRASFSVSTQISSGALVDLAKFRKLVFELYTEGTQYGNKTLTLYSCSTSASSISSASSNWTAITSVSVVQNSSLASVSSNQYVTPLEIRPEYLNSLNSVTIRYIRPVITCTSGVSSNSVDNAYLVVKGLTAHYGPASQVEPVSTFVVGNAEFL